ncbi:BatD family protein [Bacteroides faecium]|uniref:Protein BatD n=1 Tax=Bacteroides faecium TaxID=2715212 RepID=A0A6H0KJD4_9BACE|nr:BatD family protein [Bacteroides faecium]QIU93395.1 protein BatD [Bacteroides faecium]
MRTIGILASILFVCNATLLAQPTRVEIKTKKDYQLKGNVKQVVNDTTGHILKFTPEGYLQFMGFLKNGKLEGSTYTYDKAGHLVKENSWGNTVYIYTYNVRGQMIKEQMMDGAKCINSKTFLYDMNGNARQETSRTGTVCKLKNTYDSQKRLIKIERILLPSNNLYYTTSISYLSNGWTRHILREELDQIVTEYDNKGRERSNMAQNNFSNISMKSITNYDDNDNLIEYQGSFGTNLYTYNAQGEQISKEEIDLDGNKSKTVYIYLKHDAKGNWTERIVSNLTTYKRYTETRSITYYEDASTPTTTNDPIDAFFGKGNPKIPNNGDFVASAPSTVVAGEQFRLNYTIGIGNVDNFKAPSLNNFNVLMGPSKSTSTSTEVIKGAVTSKSSITYTFVLQAEKTGNFTISSAIVESKGKTYTSNTVTIKVTSK